MKEGAIRIFEDAKWHSNVSELEESERGVEDGGTFAKQQLGQTKAKTGSFLGLSWDKQEDQISVTMPQYDAVASKRTLLRNLARIYDLLWSRGPGNYQGKVHLQRCLQREGGLGSTATPTTSKPMDTMEKRVTCQGHGNKGSDMCPRAN